MRAVELKVLVELMKNRRRSDRKLAKTVGVSQPAVSGIRMRLEMANMIDYGEIPNLIQLAIR